MISFTVSENWSECVSAIKYWTTLGTFYEMFHNDHYRAQDNSESEDKIKGLDVNGRVPDIKSDAILPSHCLIITGLVFNVFSEEWKKHGSNPQTVMEKTKVTPGINFLLPAERCFSIFYLDSNSEGKCLRFKLVWITKQEN